MIPFRNKKKLPLLHPFVKVEVPVIADTSPDASWDAELAQAHTADMKLLKSEMLKNEPSKSESTSHYRNRDFPHRWFVQFCFLYA
jgi:hypothetical protein